MNWLLANTVAALVLSVLVTLIARIWKPTPTVMHGLWLMVVLKLVTPPLFEVPVDFTWLGKAATEAAETVAPTGRPATDDLTTPHLTSAEPATILPTLSANDVVTLHASAAPPEAAALPTTEATNIPWLWLWLSSSTLLLLGTAWQTHSVHRRKVAFGPVPIGLRLEVRELAERIGVDVPKLCDDPQSAAPYVWTIGRTRLVLPVAILRQCSRKGRAAVLAHELAHLRRRDHWVARGELVLLTLLWWHPLFWFARSRMRLWAELACDQIAVATVPDANLDYATLLVDAAARPLTPPPGVAILASRPVARAAFERRLKMILSETLPRRASRAWCVPFAGLVLGLFAVPVAAQSPDPDPVRIEIRVNGKTVKNLSAAQREALLEVLLDDKLPSKAERRIVVRKPKANSQGKGRRRSGGKKKIEGLPSGSDLKAMLNEGLAEARREIKNDPDLEELGITDEVLDMIDGIANGEGIESSLDDVIGAAMKGAGKMVIRELKDDEDLRRLGLDKGIAKLVTGLLENKNNQKLIGQLARTALGSALDEAKAEIRSDKDLQKLGISKDVERLIDSVMSGQGNFEEDLSGIIEKAMEAAMEEVEGEIEREVRSNKTKQKAKADGRRRRETIR